MKLQNQLHFHPYKAPLSKKGYVLVESPKNKGSFTKFSGGSSFFNLPLSTINDFQLFKSSIESGISILEKDPSDKTSLHRLFEHPEPNFQVYSYLVSNGVRILDKDMAGNTALHSLMRQDSPSLEIIDDHLKKGFNINTKGFMDETLLHSLLDSPRPSINALNKLLECGADFNAKKKNGYSPLHKLLKHSSPSLDALKLLLAKGADINAKDDFGRTPLDFYKYLHSNNIDKYQDLKKIVLGEVTQNTNSSIKTKDCSKKGFWDKIASFFKIFFEKIKRLFGF